MKINDVIAIGFNVETVIYKNLKFQVWDLGGQTGIRSIFILFLNFSIIFNRPYWRSYYPNTNAIIYVVDSVDRERLEISKQELFLMLEVSISI